MSKKSFPMYFHDTIDNYGVKFTSEKSTGWKYKKGKLSHSTSLGLNFWIGSIYPQVSYQEFRKIG